MQDLINQQDTDRVLLWPEVAAIVPLSRVTIWKLRSEGRFPAPIKLSANRIGWRLADLRQWIATRDVA